MTEHVIAALCTHADGPTHLSWGRLSSIGEDRLHVGSSSYELVDPSLSRWVQSSIIGVITSHANGKGSDASQLSQKQQISPRCPWPQHRFQESLFHLSCDSYMSEFMSKFSGWNNIFVQISQKQNLSCFKVRQDILTCNVDKDNFIYWIVNPRN